MPPDAFGSKVRALDSLPRRRKAPETVALDDDGLLKSDAGAIKPCEHNARLLIAGARQYNDLHYDEFLSRMRFGARDWTDADEIECLCWLQSRHAVARFTIGQARNGARALAYSRQPSPMRGGASDDPLMRAASRNFFVALIARALHPGAKVDTLWTFEGPQGTGKSLALHALGEGFHAEITAPIGTTDFMRELRGVWLAELSELDSLRGREASTVKRLLSAPADRFVQKYALHAESYPRRAIAVATTNEAAYWQDSTGARRLVPIACTDIRVDIAGNRLQWLAEARHAHAAGATWWEFPDGISEAQEQRQQVTLGKTCCAPR